MTNSDLKQRLHIKLDKIAGILYSSAGKFENNGILSGNSGLALFMFYYSRFVNDRKFSGLGEEILFEAADMINHRLVHHSYCSGISGLGWTCNHLAAQNFIESTDIRFLEELDPFLMSRMTTDFEAGYYDFLHGGLGVGYYFTNRTGAFDYLVLLLSYLKDNAEKTPDGCLKWKSIFGSDEKEGYNISLSHGISSIVTVLVKLSEYYPALFGQVEEIISGAIKYIIKQELSGNSLSRFPNYSLESEINPEYSRLGWCYGDTLLKYRAYNRYQKAGNKNNFHGGTIRHQSIFVKKEILELYPFSLKYKYASDYELICKIFRNNHPVKYLPFVISYYDMYGVSAENINEGIAEMKKIRKSIYPDQNNQLMKNKAPEISVILPVYNASMYLDECIGSILKQSLSDFELLVIDDGSTDSGMEIVRKFKDSRITIVSMPHDFISSLNTGLDKAQGTYIVRMDADDVMLPHRLETQYRFMETYPGIDICGSWAMRFGTGQGVMQAISGHQQIISSLLFSNQLIHPTVMMRHSIFDDPALRYTEGYPCAEDYKLWTILAGRGFRFANIPEVLLRYRRSSSQMTERNDVIMNESSYRIQMEYAEQVMAQIVEKEERYFDFFDQLVDLTNDGLIGADGLLHTVYHTYTRFLKNDDLQ